jgi:threonine dehydratase
MAASLEAGRIVDIQETETIAEAVAGGIEPGSVTFPLCRELVDSIVMVEEAQIKKAMLLLFAEHRRMVEGAGALSLAGLLETSAQFQGRKAVLIVSGGNISSAVFKSAVA